MKLYDLQRMGNDGLMYGLRVLQTEEEVKQLQSVGIMGNVAWEIISIESVPDILLKCLEGAQPVAQPFPEADLTGVSVCCGEYAKCGRPCTPRGRWQAEQAQPVAQPMDITDRERMLVSELRYIASITSGQAKRVAEQAVSRAAHGIEAKE